MNHSPDGDPPPADASTSETIAGRAPGFPSEDTDGGSFEVGSSPGLAAGATLDLPATLRDVAGQDPAQTQAATIALMSAAARHTSEPEETLADHGDPNKTVAFTSDGAGARPGKTTSASGQVLPGYEILEELGRGGMGVVYKARQTALDRVVAVKMILAGVHAGDDQLARFHLEAQAIAQLRHPGIIQVHDIGEHQGLPYFSLEYVDGGSLAQKIGGRPMSPRAAAEMLLELARAMQAAHSKGIIHRDLKPANILLDSDGQPKITDFGLAKRLEGDSKQTRSGAIMGTPSYMAPEQALGRTHEIGPLADQYALGSILYEMLTGRPPFQGATALETLELARTQEPVPPTRLQPKIPTDLETICLKCLQKEAPKRYADSGALSDDVGRFLDGKPILARPISSPERAWRWCRRNPKVAALTAAVALLLLSTAVIATTAAVRLDRKNNDLRIAIEETKKAQKKESQAREIAETKRREAVLAQVAEKDQREKAQDVAALAFEQGKFAVNSLRYLTVLASQRLAGVPTMQGVRAELLQVADRDLSEASDGMERVARKASEYRVIDDEKIGFTMIGVSMRIGEAYLEMGEFAKAGRQYEVMDARAEETFQRHPASLEAKSNLAYSKVARGNFLLYQASRLGEAGELFRRAVDLRRELLVADSTPNRRLDLAQALGALARLSLQNGDPARARELYEEELTLREGLPESLTQDIIVRRELAGLYEKLGMTYFKLRDTNKGRDFLDKSLAMREALRDETSGSVYADYSTSTDMLLIYRQLGEVSLVALREPEKARGYFARSLEGFRELYRRDSTNAFIEGHVAMVEYMLAATLLRLGDRKGADDHFRACLELRRKQIANPGNGDLKNLKLNLMVALARCGDHEEASKLASWLIQSPPQDPHDYFQSACGYALSAGAVAHGRAPKDLSAEDTALVRRYTDAAFSALRRGLAAGWKSAVDVEVDPDLDPIRDDPGFSPLLEEFRRAEAAGRGKA